MENHAATCIVEVFTIGKPCGTGRYQTAVIPCNFNLWHSYLRHIVACGEHEFDHLRIGGGFVEQQCRAAVNLCGIAELQTLEHRVKDMARHIAEGACAEIPPATEIPGGIA